MAPGCSGGFQRSWLHGGRFEAIEQGGWRGPSECFAESCVEFFGDALELGWGVNGEVGAL